MGGPRSRWSGTWWEEQCLTRGALSWGALSFSSFLFSSHPLPFPFLLLNSGQNKYLTILFDLEKDVDVNQWSQTKEAPF